MSTLENKPSHPGKCPNWVDPRVDRKEKSQEWYLESAKEWCVWEWSAVETQPSPILQHFYHGRGDALIRPTNEVEP